LSLISIVATIVLLPSDHPISGIRSPLRDPEPKAARVLLLMPYVWGLLGLLLLFFSPARCFYPRLRYSCRPALAGTGTLLEPVNSGVVFAYAGLINIIVQGLLLTQAGRFASDRIIVLVCLRAYERGIFWYRHCGQDWPSCRFPNADHPWHGRLSELP